MKGGEIFDVSMQSHSYILLFESHSRGELFAIDVNPINVDEYVTASDDGVVMVWKSNLEENEQEFIEDFGAKTGMEP
jgi:WD40 repeat protein